MIENPYDAALAAATYLKSQTEAPAVAVVLGSGLGALADEIESPQAFGYTQIPGFPDVGVAGHAGKLVVGNLPGGPRIAALAGRIHLYEGHPIANVVHAVRTLHLWGVKAALITNAAGGINGAFVPGDLMLITDHLNLSGQNPLTGHNDERLGVRFPDMSTAYDPALCDELRAAAKDSGVNLREGVYAGLAGPSYETPAEIRMLQTMGADAVGMSTVCEVIAANHCGLRTVGVSCITNLAAGFSATALDHAEVKETADQARDAFLSLVRAGLSRIAEVTK